MSDNRQMHFFFISTVGSFDVFNKYAYLPIIDTYKVSRYGIKKKYISSLYLHIQQYYLLVNSISYTYYTLFF